MKDFSKPLKEKKVGMGKSSRRVENVALFVQPDSHELTPPLQDIILEEVYRCNGSLVKACQTLNIPYGTVKKWKRSIPEFKEALDLIQEVIMDEVHDQYMGHVLDSDERNPAWKIFYLKAHDLRYKFADKPSSQKAPTINIVFTDSTFKPVKIIQGEVVEPLSIESGDVENGE